MNKIAAPDVVLELVERNVSACGPAHAPAGWYAQAGWGEHLHVLRDGQPRRVAAPLEGEWRE